MTLIGNSSSRKITLLIRMGDFIKLSQNRYIYFLKTEENRLSADFHHDIIADGFIPKIDKPTRLNLNHNRPDLCEIF